MGSTSKRLQLQASGGRDKILLLNRLTVENNDLESH